MQGILISLATAIIVMIAGAFAAPFVVDWNNWRGTFEREISAALGIPVSIRGQIDAELLPAPRMVLRDVTLGRKANGQDPTSGGTMQELDAELSLGALLRGDIQATGLTLVRPHLRLVVDQSGRITSPGSSGQAVQLSIARMEIQEGTLDVRDEASGTTLTLNHLNLNGEARSLSGPFRLDGTLATQAGEFNLRSSLGELNGQGAGRLRFSLEGRNQPYDILLDGTFQMAGGLPAFNGRATLAHLAARDAKGSVDWRATSEIAATTTQIDATGIELSFGALAATAQLTGTGYMRLKPGISLDAELSARAFDLDALHLSTPQPASGSAAVEVPSPAMRAVALVQQMVPALAGLPAPDASSQVRLNVGQLSLGGSLVHDVKLEIAGTDAGWHLSTLEAAMPGEATLTASARSAGTHSELLEGRVVLAAKDPTSFLRWVAPSAPQAYIQALSAPFRLETQIATSSEKITLHKIQGEMDAGRLSGELALSLAQASAPHLNASLALDGFALDTLIPAAQSAALFAGHVEATLHLTGQNLTFASAPVANLQLEAHAKEGGLSIPRLTLDDPGGLHVEGHGTLEQASAPPRGTFELSILGKSAAGLPTIAEILAGPQAGAVLKHMQPQAAPVELKSTLVWHGLEGREARFSGKLGDMSGEATFTHDTGQERPDITLSAQLPNAAPLLEALHIPAISLSPGPAQLAFRLATTTRDAADLSGSLTVAGLKIEGEGTGRWESETFKPQLSMQLQGEDLGRLIPSLTVITGKPLPADLRFTLAAIAPSWRLENISGTLANAPFSGTLDITQGDILHLAGQLAVDALSVPHLLALFTADIAETPDQQIWPSTPFIPARLSSVDVDLKLSARTISLLPPYSASDGQLRLQVGNGVTEIRDLTGAFGEGRLSAGLRIRQKNEALEADGRLMMEHVSLADLAKPSGAATTPEGRINLSVDLAGSGSNLSALVQSLGGQGTISAEKLIVPAVTTDALAEVMDQTEKLDAPPGEAETARLLDAALARGRLVIPSAASTLGVSNGIVRLSPAHASVDETRVILSGTVDLTDLDLDARLDFEKPVGAYGMAGGSVVWNGPLEALQRRVSAVPLASALSMRTIERETKRLEQERAEGERRQKERRERTQAPPANATSQPNSDRQPAVVQPSPPVRPAPAQPAAPRPRAAAPSGQVVPASPPQTQSLEGGIQRQSLPPPGQAWAEPLPAPLPNYQPNYSVEPLLPPPQTHSTPQGSIGLH